MSLCDLQSSKLLLMYVDKQHEAAFCTYPVHTRSITGNAALSVCLNAASSAVPLVSMSSANNTLNKGKVSARGPRFPYDPQRIRARTRATGRNLLLMCLFRLRSHWACLPMLIYDLLTVRLKTYVCKHSFLDPWGHRMQWQGIKLSYMTYCTCLRQKMCWLSVFQ